MSLLVPIRHNHKTSVLENGQYPALLYRIIQIGTVNKRYKNRDRQVKTLLLSFVIPSVKRVLSDGSEVFYTGHTEVTESMAETAELRQIAINMTGYDFIKDMQEGQLFDVNSMLGRECLISTERYGDQGVNITGYQPMPDDELPIESPYEIHGLYYADFNDTHYNQLAQRVKDKMAETPEYKAMIAARAQA